MVLEVKDDQLENLLSLKFGRNRNLSSQYTNEAFV